MAMCIAGIDFCSSIYPPRLKNSKFCEPWHLVFRGIQFVRPKWIFWFLKNNSLGTLNSDSLKCCSAKQTLIDKDKKKQKTT